MGAVFQSTQTDFAKPATAIRRGHNMIEDCQYNYGHAGYSGTFAEASGVKMTDKVFDTMREAEDWLDENCQKWGPILIVAVREPKALIYGALCSE